MLDTNAFITVVKMQDIQLKRKDNDFKMKKTTLISKVYATNISALLKG